MTDTPLAGPLGSDESNPEPRVEHLVIARESDTQDLPMLEGMILQTLGKYPHLPGHAKLVELAAQPVSTPEVVDHVTHEEGSTRAIEFEVDGTVCLYSRGTAAGADSSGDNGFSKIVARLLARYRPENVYVATFSRLVRSHYFAHDVFKVLNDNHITLWDGVSDPIRCWQPAGRMRWQMLVMFVDMERESILLRTTLGKLARHRRGQWVQTYRSLPLGYMLENDRLVPRPGIHDTVNKAIRAIGTPGTDMHEVMRALGDIGVSVPLDDTGWGFDPTWQWDGTPYVPERYRVHTAAASTGGSDANGLAQAPDPDRDTGATGESGTTADDLDEGDGDGDGTFGLDLDVEANAREQDLADSSYTGPTRRLIHEHDDLHGPAQRILRYLDLWEHGTITLRIKNVLDVPSYAEYPVHDNTGAPGGYGYIELAYTPPAPDEPWATPDEFAAARVAQQERLAAADRRVTNSNRRLPFLGHVSRWTQDNRAYALVSQPGGRAITRTSYYLYSQPAQEHPRRTANGALLPLTWRRNGRTNELLKKELIVRAHDLHAAVSAAATDALRAGLTLTASPDAPPTFLGGDLNRRRRNLARQAGEAEDKAARFLERSIQPDTDPDFANFCDRQSQEQAAAARALRAELAGLSTTPTETALPEQITIDGEAVALVLAGLRSCTGNVTRQIAADIRDVFADFRITRDGPHARFSFYLRLPAEDGVVLAGPITGNLPQTLGSDQPGDLDPEYREQLRDERAYGLAHLLMTTDTTVREAVSSRPVALDSYTTGAAQAERAASYLQTRGLTPAATRAALAALPLVTRRIIWSLAQNEPVDETVDPEFVERLRDTYLTARGVAPNNGSWLTENTVQDAIHRHVLDNPGQTLADFQTWATRVGLGKSAHKAYLRGPRDCSPVAARRHVGQIQNSNGTTTVWPVACPHCDHGLADTLVRVPENPRTLLCSDCRHAPETLSPQFPAEYLAVSAQLARTRAEDTNPVLRYDPLGYVVSIPVNERIAAWITDNDAWEGTRRVVTKLHVAAYYLALVEGRAHDDAAIRDWANRAGHQPPARGRLPAELTDLFIHTILRRDPGPVRRWAATQSRPVARHGANRKALHLDYAEAMRAANTGIARL